MSLLNTAIDWALHLDQHLVALVARFGPGVYGILFTLIFAETGLVVTPFLPGDSLLFGVGALAAVDATGTLRLSWLYLLLAAAAIAGNSLNYMIGRRLGRRAFSGRYRLFSLSHLQRTEDYFGRHGGLAVLLSRFMPIVRTFAPFVAGIGRMSYGRFQVFNIAGALGWVALFLMGGYGFGNLPWVHRHFSIVTLAVVAISLVPLLFTARRDQRAAAASRP